MLSVVVNKGHNGITDHQNHQRRQLSDHQLIQKPTTIDKIPNCLQSLNQMSYGLQKCQSDKEITYN